MIIKALHHYYIDNKDAVKIDNNGFTSPEGEIYEVIRITNGIPLFMEDHIERFFNSASLAGIGTGLTPGDIENRINRLIATNQVNSGNIRFSFLTSFRAFFLPHKYPDDTEYKEGITCGLLYTERINPQAKTMQASVREIADRLIRETGNHEVILVDQKKQVTEGSRSNIFFVRDDFFFTPSSSDVLPGTTRKRVISLINNLKVNLTEGKIKLDDLNTFEAAFITGTSPKILPIHQIENLSFRTDHPLVRRLMKKYDELIEEYLQKKKSLVQ